MWKRSVYSLRVSPTPVPGMAAHLPGFAQRTQEPALRHQLHRQRLVAHGLEQDHHLVAVVALHHPLPPVGMDHGPTRRKGLGRAVRDAVAGVAVVTVAARWIELLAEVAEDEVAPAVLVLGVGPHRVDAGAVEAVAFLLRFHR